MTGSPLLLDLTDRLVVVVGGGGVATRRVEGLVAGGARLTVIAPNISPAITALGVRSQVRAFVDGDLDGAWLVVAATDDPEVNAAVAAEAERRRIFCVRADDATGGTARVPSVLRSGGLTLSVNAGDDPRRAVAVRNAIAAALDTGLLGARPARPAAAGSVALVGGGPGDPELITVRGRRLVFEADVVVTDRLAPRALLEQLDASVEIIDCGKSAHRHNLTQDEINAVIVERALAGKRVVRLKGGDPFVFGRGGEEVAACLSAGVDVSVVPGITSAVAAPAAAGIPVTHRGLAADFAVVSGHRDPGRAEAGWNWAELAVGPATLIVLMGVDTLAGIVEELISHGRPPHTPAAAIHRATLPGQQVVRAPLSGLVEAVASARLTAPAVVVIGEVAALGW
ncbi:uroporphyrinogen-III C-methyltransferase [Jatrophihabitans telluris]|uniref:Uroporphyrinogen-III C-methyltransferase n=1 Tax=Jatrophihabitans telluris TaxID=2038343 RepID=A0ABY4QUS5_9ACTN|nr:uroporphyrinogen-III C-methyltransferase [Jatrophihabitans telluris]UQX87205.1 uroporphyrinogen-III C-methyltransferase [Jatrophihabitans telluris]